jgi:adenylate kinase
VSSAEYLALVEAHAEELARRREADEQRLDEQLMRHGVRRSAA